MFRVLFRAIQQPTRYVFAKQLQRWPIINPPQNGLQAPHFSTLQHNSGTTALLSNPKVQDISNSITRNLIKFSWRDGKRKTVKAVLRRFYRLDWGGWIRTKAGRHKKLWKKHSARRRRLRQHVLCNATQSTLLDKMVNNYWRKPKYYVEDPYEPYHSREEYRTTYKNPKPYINSK